MSTDSTAIKNSYDLAAKVNRIQFLGIVQNTVGYNELRKEDRVAYLAGAGMMFDKLAPYAQLRIAMEKDNAAQFYAGADEVRNDFRTLAQLIDKYKGD